MKIIKEFVAWSKKNKSVWEGQSEHSEEKVVLNRLKLHGRMILGFGVVSNLFVYQAFLTGIYNYRYHELLNMRRVPFALKIGLSSAVTGYMCYLMYNDSLYDEDVYRLATKYRTNFDSSYSTNLTS